MDEFQQNRSTRGVATADFLTSGLADWWINFFVLFYLKTIEMCRGISLSLGEIRCQLKNLIFLEIWPIFSG